MIHALRRHSAAAALCAAAAGWWLWPLLTNIRDAVPGGGPGDNLTFVWNVWWTRFALQHTGFSVFFSPFIFHPMGADLTLHTSTLLPALAVSWIENPVAAQNVEIAAHVFLNFACVYLLAWRETRHWGASVAAAIAFGWSPYIAAHLSGHFNLIAAWVLPLAAWSALAVRDAPSVGRGALLGAILGAVAYVDYYYVVYALILAVTLGVDGSISVARLADRRRVGGRWLTITIVAGVVLALAAAAAIAVTGGIDLRVAGRRVSAHGVANPMAVGWLLVLAGLTIQAASPWCVHVDWSVLRGRVPAAAAAVVAIAVIMTPVTYHAAALWRAGGYTSQQYLWRSAPAGVDIATLVLGNPSNLLYGVLSRRAYESLDVDLVEHVAWVGPAILVLCVVAIRQCGAAARTWLLPAAIFGVWALGPYVEIAGRGTTLWLPATIIRWIPLVANARIPARAMIVVYLCCAILTAHGLVWLRAAGRWVALTIAVALLLADALPRRPDLYRVPAAGVYSTMRADTTPGAVCELPLGIRDGFGEAGRFDARVLYFQTLHGRPILGGFLARLPRSIPAWYRDTPVVSTLLRLSGGEPLAAATIDADRGRAAEVLSSLAIRY